MAKLWVLYGEIELTGAHRQDEPVAMTSAKLFG